MAALDEIIRSLPSNGMALGIDEQRHALALLRTLAEGRPVPVDVLARRTDLRPHEVEAFVGNLPGVYRDDRGDIVGFWGLTVAEMPPHEYRIGDRTLYAWCAWDPFIITPWLGGSAEVRSIDARTKERIRFKIVDGSVAELSHDGLTLSFTTVGEWRADVIATFCHFIHYFVDERSAASWVDGHPGTFILSLPDALELGRAWGEHVFPDLGPHA